MKFWNLILLAALLPLVVISGCTPPSAPVQPQATGGKRLLPPHPREDQIVAQMRAAGNGLWVVDSARYQATDVAEVAHRIGAGNVMPRYGGAKRNLKPAQLRQMADELWAEGIKIQPWIYAYQSSAYGFLKEIYESLGGHPGFVGVMLNVEHTVSEEEARKLADAADRYRQRHAEGTLIGYTGYNLGLTHRRSKAEVFLEKVDYWSPQVYWGVNGSDPKTFLIRGYKEWLQLGQNLGYDPVIAPAGQAFWKDVSRVRMRPGQMAEFAKLTQGYPAISWYTYDQLWNRPEAIEELASVAPIRDSSTQVPGVQPGQPSSGGAWSIAVWFGTLALWGYVIWITVTLLTTPQVDRKRLNYGWPITVALWVWENWLKPLADWVRERQRRR